MPTPGVNRPMNLVDVLNNLSGQGAGAGIGVSMTGSGGSAPGIAVVAEADEPATPISDTATGVAVATVNTWDNGAWNAIAWT